MYFYMWINHYFLILSYTRAFIGCSSLFTVHVQGLVIKQYCFTLLSAGLSD